MPVQTVPRYSSALLVPNPEFSRASWFTGGAKRDVRGLEIMGGPLQTFLAGLRTLPQKKRCHGSWAIYKRPGVQTVFHLVALVANVTCLMLIAKKKDSGAHMKASWIFSANDVIANTGVILAGILVMLTGSAIPDLLIGLIIVAFVLNGARRILQIKS